jgi:hypothetical protein
MPAHAAAPMPTIVAETTKAVAVVESVDPTTRQILLSGPNGGLLTLIAGPNMQNFDQIKSGDRLYLTYRKAIAVALAPTDKPLAQPTGMTGARLAARGQMPAGAGFVAVSVEVQIDAIDRRAHTVTFTNAAGEKRTMAVRDPAFQHFAGKLKAGDRVRLEYLQSVSIKLKPDTGN